MILVWPMRVGHRLLAYLHYSFIRFGLPVASYLDGFKRSIIGKCIIFAPPKQMQVIMDGVTYLQTLDPNMFMRLTAERRYVFWYYKRDLQCREIFSICDNFILWGKEGVVTFFVQCILDYNLKLLPLDKTLGTREASAARRRQIQQLLFEWLNKQSFNPELVRQYQEFAEAGSENENVSVPTICSGQSEQ